MSIVHVPLQIGVVFNAVEAILASRKVIVPLQNGVVFNKRTTNGGWLVSYRPLTKRGSL